MAQLSRPHILGDFEGQLDRLRELLLDLGLRASSMLDSAVVALTEHDAALAAATRSLDRRINRGERDVDHLCQLILARYRPVASDLRGVTFALKVVTDIERLGDIAAGICSRVEELQRMPARPHLPILATLAQSTLELVHLALECLLRRDAVLAEEVMARDVAIDNQYSQLVRELMEFMRRDPAQVEAAVHLLAIGQHLERAGDHGTNLAEQVIYLVRGTDVRHLDA